MIVGRENINRAVHGDVVAIQVLPESEWRGMTDTIVEEGDITRTENADVDDENVEVEDEVESRERRILREGKEDRKKGIQVTAKVVGIIKRNWRTYLIIISPSPSTFRSLLSSIPLIFSLFTSLFPPLTSFSSIHFCFSFFFGPQLISGTSAT